MRRRLLEEGFVSRYSAKKPFLTLKMKKKRLQWAKEHKNWTLDDWKSVIFSDESKFNLLNSDGARNVHRKEGERLHVDCVSPSVKFSPSVMVWGCITSYGLGPLLFLDGTVDSKKYKSIIKNHVVPTIEELTEHVPNPIFQDDSAPCHRAKIV